MKNLLVIVLLVMSKLAYAAQTVSGVNQLWMMVATLLVLLMALPGLGFFYSGMLRVKNALSVLAQISLIVSLILLLWTLYGYSLAFGGDGRFIGGFSKLFAQGIQVQSVVATFTKEVYIPEIVYFMFQGGFAAISVAIIVGSLAERVKFSALLFFSVFWFSFAYLPIAHMTWYWAGPDAIFDAQSLDQVSSTAGMLWASGVLDFAGGGVVHINAGIAGLVGAIMIGSRIGYGREAMLPHSLPLTLLGSALLWVGWFGFNAGSALEVNGIAALAFANTALASAAACLAWSACEWFWKTKPSLLGAASGLIAGLVGITPACGFVGLQGAIVIGIVSGIACFFAVTKLKKRKHIDDSLDVFGIHGVGGIVGALLTAVFTSPALGGEGLWDYVLNAQAEHYSIATQLWIQAKAIVITICISAFVAWLGFWLADRIFGLRVREDREREGLDISEHGETAYSDKIL